MATEEAAEAADTAAEEERVAGRVVAAMGRAAVERGARVEEEEESAGTDSRSQCRRIQLEIGSRLAGKPRRSC